MLYFLKYWEMEGKERNVGWGVYACFSFLIICFVFVVRSVLIIRNIIEYDRSYISYNLWDKL